jgi:hypothetical protein
MVKEAAASAPETGQDIQSAPETGQDIQYHLSDLLNKTVGDKTGKEVARLTDLEIGAHGRILSVTLTPAGGTGAKITIPFERLKVAERGGSLYLETDVVVGAGDGPPSKTAQEGQKSAAGALKAPESKPR